MLWPGWRGWQRLSWAIVGEQKIRIVLQVCSVGNNLLLVLDRPNKSEEAIDAGSNQEGGKVQERGTCLVSRGFCAGCKAGVALNSVDEFLSNDSQSVGKHKESLNACVHEDE